MARAFFTIVDMEDPNEVFSQTLGPESGPHFCTTSGLWAHVLPRTVRTDPSHS